MRAQVHHLPISEPDSDMAGQLHWPVLGGEEQQGVGLLPHTAQPVPQPAELATVAAVGEKKRPHTWK